MILKSISPILLFCVLTIPIMAQVNKPTAKPKPKPTASPVTKSEPIAISEVTTKDGRKVVLKSDNTWEYIQTPAVNTPISEPEENKYRKIPLSDDATKLPKFYQGQDFTWLHDILTRKQTFKGEYETTEDYEKRVALKEAFHQTSQFAIFPFGGVPAYKMEFNADSKQFSVSVKFEDKGLFLYQPYKPIFDFNTVSASRGMGFFGIVVTNPDRFAAPFSFPVDAERAKIIKDNSSVLVLFHLKPPYSYDAEVSGGGIVRWLIVGEINDIWLVNKETGEIYAKLMK